MALRLFLAVLLSLHIAPFPTQTNGGTDVFDSGTHLYEVCAAGEHLGETESPTRVDAFNAGMCIGFISGVVQGVSGSESAHGLKLRDGLICLPEGSSRLQEIRVVRKYIMEHPENAHLAAVIQVIKALHEAFPCK